MRRTPLIIGFDQTKYDQALDQWLHQINPIGVILFKKNCLSKEQTNNLISDIKSNYSPNIFISIDNEGGAVWRTASDLPSIPSPFALAQSGDWNLIEKNIYLQADILYQLGFNTLFAPVLDRFITWNNRAISSRAFAFDIEKICAYFDLVHKIFQQYNITIVGKHFPGLGRAVFDPHFEQGVINIEKKQFDEDIHPFVHAINQNIAGLMTSHCLHPNIDPDHITTFSTKTIQSLLIEQLGFKNIIFSDCLEMQAAQSVSPEMIANQTLKAGYHILIASFNLKGSKEFIVELKKGIELFQKETSQNQSVDLSKFIPQEKTLHLTKQIDYLAAQKVYQKLIRSHQKLIQQEAYIIIEVPQKKPSGINQNESFFSLSAVLKRTNEKIKRIVSFYQLFEEKVDLNGGVILLSFDAFQLDHAFFGLIDQISEKNRSVHIALNSDGDLTGKFAFELPIFGYNNEAMKMIQSELNQRL